MFSDRFFKILLLLTQQGIKFGSCTISVNLQDRIFVSLDNPKIISRIKINYNLVCFWAFSSFALVVKFAISGETERYKITLFIWMTGITATIIYSIHRWLTIDLVIAVNFTAVLFRHLQSTLKHK